jgi:hypothetical protein
MVVATGSVGAKDSAKGSRASMPCTGSGGEPAIIAATSSPIGASMLGGR